MYSVVVPCYNEEKNIRRLVERFDRIHSSLKENGKKMELILVDNGSVDGSHALIQSIMGSRDYIKEVQVKVNQGYGYGILQGLKACVGEYLFWIHADLQLPPEAILDMIHILDESNQPKGILIKGNRKNRPLSDRFFTFGMSIFESAYLGALMHDINAQPTCISRDFYESWNNPPYDFSLDLYVYYMAVKKKLRIQRVGVLQSERQEGQSSWNTGMKARVKFIMRTITYSRTMKQQLKNTR